MLFRRTHPDSKSGQAGNKTDYSVGSHENSSYTHINNATPASLVYIIYDCEHDQDLCTRLERELPSLPLPGRVIGKTNHQDNRLTIAQADKAIIIVGNETYSHLAVLNEISIIRQLGIDFFMLHGRYTGTVEKPEGMLPHDKIYVWTAENLEYLMEGVR
jgi:hypothetical protein